MSENDEIREQVMVTLDILVDVDGRLDEEWLCTEANEWVKHVLTEIQEHHDSGWPEDENYHVPQIKSFYIHDTFAFTDE